MRITLKDTIAVGIDYQERLIPAMDDKETLIRNATVLFQGLEAMEVPLIFSRQYPKGIGDTVAEIREVTSTAKVFDKMSFSCWQDTAIKAAIEALKPKTVILSGTEAHVCVLQTAVDLQAAGYQVVYVTDCVGSRKAMDKKYGIKRVKQEGALLVTYEQLLFELLSGAESPYFKAVSKLVK
jgi:hypothetical protein